MARWNADVAIIGARAAHDHQVAPVVDQLIEQFPQLQAFIEGSPQEFQGFLGIALQDCFGKGNDLVDVSGAQQAIHVLGGQPLLTKGEKLIEEGLSIAHGAGRPACDQLQSFVVGLQLFVGHHLPQVPHDSNSPNPRKIEALASGQDGQGNLLDLGRGENELHMGRGLFQRLEQGVEGSCSYHVDFVNDVNLESRPCRPVLDVLAKVPDLVNSVIAGTVDF